jgi:hypothetical protein
VQSAILHKYVRIDNGPTFYAISVVVVAFYKFCGHNPVTCVSNGGITRLVVNVFKSGFSDDLM